MYYSEICNLGCYVLKCARIVCNLLQLLLFTETIYLLSLYILSGGYMANNRHNITYCKKIMNHVYMWTIRNYYVYIYDFRRNIITIYVTVCLNLLLFNIKLHYIYLTESGDNQTCTGKEIFTMIKDDWESNLDTQLMVLETN